jgi:ubiquinone/menaquinone biosynthesis C-methylase UbiE
VSPSFERIADTYDETRGGVDRGRRFALELHTLLDPAKSVVEIGAGTGVVATGLQEMGHRIAGFDLSEGMLRRARRRVGPRVAVADARRLPLADGSVDQALSVWVLHVVGDIRAVLREVARILRPGGRYLVVPAMAVRPGDPLGGLIWEMEQRLDPRGRRRDDEDSLRGLAPAAGLRVVESREWHPHAYDESPIQVLRKLETRSYSVLWDITEEQWRDVVVPIIEAVRALPDPDRPISRGVVGRVIVLEREA